MAYPALPTLYKITEIKDFCDVKKNQRLFLNMARDDKIRMPSGMGGITRYFDDYRSKFEFSPGLVIVLCVIVLVIVIVLHVFGRGLLS